MPITAAELFRREQIVPIGTVRWGETIPETGPGVYIVSLVDLPSIGFREPFELKRDRWNPGEEIVYIGRSKGVSRRLAQFYRHRYGARSPHHGGQDILLLDGDKLITWAAVSDYADAEGRLLARFMGEVGQMPFGNRVRAARNSAGSGLRRARGR